VKLLAVSVSGVPEAPFVGDAAKMGGGGSISNVLVAASRLPAAVTHTASIW
jgi:hypothetical protein